MLNLQKTNLNSNQSSYDYIQDLGDLFQKEYLQENCVLLLHQAQILHEKLLEIISQDECVRKRPLKQNEKDIFNRCLFACCIEIEMYSNGFQQKFPWILETFNLKAFYFYRVIELIVRTNHITSRDVVNHLNSIELEIFNNITWKSDSPIWRILHDINYTVPYYADIALPEQIEYGTPVQVVPNLNDQIQPPTTPNTSLFQSPNTTKRYVSLDLFFRKFYMLAANRLDEFCEQLNINEETKQRIFTCFEHCIIKNTDIIRDRHMDQILMCSVHIIYRYSYPDGYTKQKNLTNIIDCYKLCFPNQAYVCNGLFKFYKTHFNQPITFVEQFANSPDENVPLSPLPKKNYSPKLPISENVFMRTMQFNVRQNLTQGLNRASRSKIGKRLFDDDDVLKGPKPKQKRVSAAVRKLQRLFEDRNIQNRK